MTSITVGIADCKLSAEPNSALVTYALGSCIGLAIHDPIARVGGLLHFMLPDSSIHPDKAAENPFMFADTGIPILFKRSYEMGAQKRRLTVRALGGAQLLGDEGIFNIGKRNIQALRRILWKAGVMLQCEATGGSDSRTVRLEVDTGRIFWHSAGGAEQELVARCSQGQTQWPTAS